jgi:hypothetical protein
MIVLPVAIWDQLLDTFMWKPSLEQVAFLDGLRSNTDGVVTTLTIPNAQLSAGWYRVPAVAMAEAGAHFGLHGLVRLAQVHSHPSDWTEHSADDDEFAYSQSLGSVSIVMPGGARTRPSLQACTVLVRRASGWQVVPGNEVLRTVPSVLDFRHKERHWWNR